MNNNIPDTVSERIKYYRKLANLTQAEVADALNMTRTTYANRENAGNFTLEVFKNLAKALGVTTDMLLYKNEILDTSIRSDKLLQSLALHEDSVPISRFSEKENNIIKIYRTLSPESRDLFYRLLDTIYQSQKE